MKAILFTAQSFGFGPAAKMLAIAEKITNARKVFFGENTALDLAIQHSNEFDEIYELSPNDKAQILKLLFHSDLFINVMEFSLGHLAKQAHCSHFLIDSLLHFWDKSPSEIKYADIYFCQNFFCDIRKRVKKYNLKNAKIIGPITREPKKLNKKINQAIINFGGMENEFVTIGKNSNYPFVILDCILPIIEKHFSSILVTGRERVIDICRLRYKKSKAKFAMLSHKAMIDELSRSSALFTTPGVQTIFDSAGKLPIFALPPQNDSNVKNLDMMINYGMIKHYFRWGEIYNHFLPNGSEDLRIKALLEKINTFCNDENGVDVFKQKVLKFCTERSSWPALIRNQKNLIRQLGSNGTDSIYNEIQLFLKNLRRYKYRLK